MGVRAGRAHLADSTYISLGCFLDISGGATERVFGCLSLEFCADFWAGDAGNGEYIDTA